MTNITAHLREKLRDRYPPPEWSMAFEVQVERPEGGLRFLDAVAIRTLKGRVEVHGFELKVSRSDWLREHPAKADAGLAVCDFFWVVAGSPGLIQPTEIPAGFGVLVAHGDELRIAMHPQRFHSTVRGSDNLDRALVAAFLRRLDPLEPRAYWEMRERRAEQRGQQRGRNAKMKVHRAHQRRGLGDAAPLDLP